MAQVLHRWVSDKSNTELEVLDDERIGIGGSNVREGIWGGFISFSDFLSGSGHEEIRQDFGEMVLQEIFQIVQAAVGSGKEPLPKPQSPKVTVKPTIAGPHIIKTWSNGSEALTMLSDCVTSSGIDAYGHMQGETFNFEDLLAGKHCDTLVARHGEQAVLELLQMIRELQM